MVLAAATVAGGGGSCSTRHDVLPVVVFDLRVADSFLYYLLLCQLKEDMLNGSTIVFHIKFMDLNVKVIVLLGQGLEKLFHSLTIGTIGFGQMTTWLFWFSV